MNVNIHSLIAVETPEDLKAIIPEGSRVRLLPSNRGRIVEVPLAGGDEDERALVTDHQARLLWNEGIRGRWFLNHNGGGKLYVRAWRNGKNVLIARVLTGAGTGESVRYRNEDPRDLRTENLSVVPRKKAEAPTGTKSRVKGLVVDPFTGPSETKRRSSRVWG